MRVLAVALLLFPITAQALDPPYLSHWPSAERVLADHAGADEDDTLARQMSALNVMQNSIDYMAGARRWHGLTPDEQQLRGEYYRAADRIRTRVHATHSNERSGPFGQSPLRKWHELQWSYEGDYRFRHATLARYLPAEAVRQVEAETPEIIAPPKGGGPGGKPTWLVWIAVAGALLLLLVAWRRRSVSRRLRTDPATATSTNTFPPDYTNLSESDRAMLARAGRELLDSLEPYILAAQVDGRPLPVVVLHDAEVGMFLEVYGQKALELEGASEADAKRLSRHILLHQNVISPERINRLFSDRGSPPAPADRADRRRQMLVGGLHAHMVLSTFASKEASPPEEVENTAAELGIKLAQEPPATRLHPEGPDSKHAQQLALEHFSTRLVIVAKAS